MAIDPCNGVIGLGFGTPLFGKSFLSNLAASYPSFSAVWSYSTRPWLNSSTSINLGGYSTDFIKSNATIRKFNVTHPSMWILN